MPDCSVDAVVTDPPYGLAFMGKRWDYDVPSVEIWAECLRVLKPGGHLLAFAGTRTQHRMAVRIEDAGFEIRDMIAWVYGSGFPKSLDVSKAIDKHGGQSVAWFGPWFRNWREAQGINQKQVAALFPSKTGNLTGCVANWELGFNMPTPEQFNLIRDTFGLPFESIQAAEREVVGKGWRVDRKQGAVNYGGGTPDGAYAITAPATPEAQQWTGWGTALKPALEPITLARKPFPSTVAANVLEHGTGALNLDGCRVAHAEECRMMAPSQANINSPSEKHRQAGRREAVLELKPGGRWPANLIHDGSDEVVGLFPETTSGALNRANITAENGIYGKAPKERTGEYAPDTGSAARFFYTAKATKAERQGVTHPTVKPLDLMAYLCRLVTPPGGTVLDPFMGSGTTIKAAIGEGFNAIGIERDPQYFAMAEHRMNGAQLGLPLA
jgi:DNA modification methylase